MLLHVSVLVPRSQPSQLNHLLSISHLQGYVNSGAETLNFLNRQNSGLRFTPEGKSLFQMILTEVDHVPHHVAHSVSRVSRCGTNGYISGGVFVFPERDNVQQSLLCELTDDLLQSHVELIFHVFLLLLDRISDVLLSI